MGTVALLSQIDRIGFETLRLLVGVLWQSSILFAAVAVLARVLRRRKAGFRHALWAGAILAAPLFPLLTWGLANSGAPQAEVAVLPHYEAWEISPSAFDMGRPPGDDAIEGLASSAPPPSPEATAPLGSVLDYPWALLLSLYTVGVAAFLLWVAAGWVQILLWKRCATAIGAGRVLAAFQCAADSLGVRRKFRVIESGSVRAPFTVGALSPAVILPRGWSERLSDKDLDALALHETAHVKRRDPLLFLLVALVRAVLFFHPLVWFAARRVSLFAEEAADDAVLDAAGEPFSYAKALSRIARDLRHRSLSLEIASGIVLTRSAFLRRIEAILSDRRDRIKRLSLVALAALVAATALSLVLALALPLGEKNAEPGAAAAATSDSEKETSDGAALDHFLGRYADARRPGTAAFEITKEGSVYVFHELGGPTHEMGVTERGLQFFDPAERFVVRYEAKEQIYYLDVGRKESLEPEGSLRLVKLATGAPATGRRIHSGDMVWITLLPASPIVSIEDFQCRWAMRPAMKGGLEGVDAEIEIRTADNSRQVAAGIRMTQETFNLRQLRLIGKVPDGDYLVAMTVDGVRASNVAPLRIDSNFEGKKEPVLRLVPLPPTPGRDLPYVGLVATGPDPADPKLTFSQASFPTLVVDGVERRVMGFEWAGQDRPLNPGERRLTILDLTRYEPAIAPGAHTVSAKVLAYRSAPVTIPPDVPLERIWDKPVPPSGMKAPVVPLLSGRVTRPDGKPAAGYEVGISGDSGRVRFSETCDDAGRYEFANAPPGQYTLNTNPPGQGKPLISIAEVLLEADAPRTEDLSLESKYTISGKVTYDDGSPAASLEVVAFFTRDDGGAEFQAQGVTDETGRYTIGSPFALASFMEVYASRVERPTPLRDVRAPRDDVDFTLKRIGAKNESAPEAVDGETGVRAVEMDEETSRILAAARKAMGWDRVEKMAGTLTVRTSARPWRFTLPTVKAFIVPPQAACVEVEETDSLRRTFFFPVVTGLEGLAREINTFPPDALPKESDRPGEGIPKRDFDGRVFMDDLPVRTTVGSYIPTAQEAASWTGIPERDRKGALLVLRQHQGERTLETFLYAGSMRVVASRLRIGERLIFECRGFEYEEVADGIFYPAKHEIVMDAAVIEAGLTGTETLSMSVQVDPVDVVLKEEAKEGAASSPPEGQTVASTIDDIKPSFTFTIHTVTPDGKPIPGVAIHCAHPRRGRGGEALVDMTVESDESGVAKFVVEKADLALERYFWFANASEAFKGTSGVGLSPVEHEYEYTFTLLPAEPRRVRVVNEEGKTIAGARVRLLGRVPRFGADAGRDTDGVWGNGVTGDDGITAVGFVDAATDVFVFREGYGPAIETGVELPKDTPFEITMNPGCSITGRVLDDSGRPIAGATVRGDSGSALLLRAYIDDLYPEATTDAEGRFEMRDLMATGYLLDVRFEGAPAALYFPNTRVGVSEEKPDVEVELKAVPGAAITGKYVTKHELRLAKRQVFDNSFPESREFLTAEDGTFAVTGIPAGASGSLDFVGISGYHIRLTAPSASTFLAASAEQVSLRYENIPAGIHGGVEVEFLREARVEGHVVGPEGEPFAGYVLLHPPGSIRGTESDGRYSFSCPPDKDMYVEVRAAYNGPAFCETDTFRLREGEIRTMNIVVTGDPDRDLRERREAKAERPMPPLDAFAIEPADASFDGKAMLVCFWDMDSRPSRRVVEELAAQSDTLAGRGVAVLLVHVGAAEAPDVRAYLKENRIAFPLAFVKGSVDETLARWAVESLPWLVLADRTHVIRAAGFPLADLDETLKTAGTAAHLDEMKALDRETFAKDQMTPEEIETAQTIDLWRKVRGNLSVLIGMYGPDSDTGIKRALNWSDGLAEFVKRPDAVDAAIAEYRRFLPILREPERAAELGLEGLDTGAGATFSLQGLDRLLTCESMIDRTAEKADGLFRIYLERDGIIKAVIAERGPDPWNNGTRWHLTQGAFLLAEKMSPERTQAWMDMMRTDRFNTMWGNFPGPPDPFWEFIREEFLDK